MSANGSDPWPAKTPCAPNEIDATERLRLVEAERERAIAQAQLEQRRRRRSLIVLLLSFSAVLIVGGLSVWRYIHIRSIQSDERARKTSTEQEVQHLVDNIRTRIKAVDNSDNPEQDAADLAPAFALLERVDALARESELNEELLQDIARARDDLNRVSRDLMTIAGLDRIRLDYIDARARRISAASIARRYSAAFAALGVELGSERAMASSAKLRVHHQRERLLAALSNWRVVEPDERKKNAIAYLIRITESRDAYRARLRDAMFRRDADLVAKLLMSPELLKQPAIYLCRLSIRLRSLALEERAMEVLRLGLDRYPGDFWLNAEMGGVWLHRRPNGPATAREYFKAAVAVRPQCPGANYLLGVALQRMGDYYEATTALSRAIEHDATFADAHLQLCAALIERDDLNGAIEHGRQAMALAPANPAPPTGLAAAFLAQGNMSSAKELFRKALESDGEYLPALLGLGELLREEGSLVEAELLLKRAIDQAPGKSDALNQYGLLLQARGDLPGAAATFRKAMDVSKEDPASCTNLGLVRLAQGEREEALRWFQAAIERNPKFAPAYVAIGLDHFKKGELPDAIRRLQQAVDGDARSAIAQFHLGRALRQAGDLNRALAAFRKAAELRPQWVEAQFCQGAIALQQGLFEEAADSLGRAARLCPIENPLLGLVHIYLHRAKKQVVVPQRQRLWVLVECRT
jgi:tetratricopeptide (TPR) repeat protein